MDHLLVTPASPDGTSLRIPYLADVAPLECSYDPDVDTFETYPGRVGVDPRRLAQGDAQGKSDVEVLCIIQAWCFFGLLYAGSRASGFENSVDSFLEPFGDTCGDDLDVIVDRAINTKPLHALLRKMEEVSRPESCSEERRLEVYEELLDILALISQFIIDCNTLPSADCETAYLRASLRTDQGSQPSVCDRIMLSIMTLSEFFYYANNALWRPQGVLPHELSFGKCDWVAFLKPKMNLMGWCNSEINMMAEQSAGFSTLYALSDVNRQDDEQDHSNCGDGLTCTYENLDRAAYTQRHQAACDRSQCQQVTFDSNAKQQLLDLVENEEIPLVTVSTDQAGVTSLSLHSAQQIDKVYVCVSHVWQDGLGNPRENALPSCQLRQIQQWVDELYDRDDRPMPFWMDTLCVPVEEEHRRTAIVQMFSIYKDADSVIVIESHLLARSTGTDDPRLLFMSIRSCNWMRRLWTFQEALLAKELYFQFQDRALNIDVIVAKIADHSERLDSDAHSRWAYERNEDSAGRLAEADALIAPTWHWISRLVKDLAFDEENPLSLQERLDEVLLLLCWRNTSWETDEPFCYSLILGMDVSVQKEVTRLKTKEERMKFLMEKVGSVPTNILFVNRPRLETDGFKWLPTSFLAGGRQASMLSIDSSHFGRVTPAGLIVLSHGLLIDGEIGYSDMFWVRDSSCTGFTVVTDKGHDLDIGRIKNVRLGLLLKNSLNVRGESERHNESMAALVEVLDVGDVIIVSYLRLVQAVVGPPPHGREDKIVELETVLDGGQMWVVR